MRTVGALRDAQRLNRQRRKAKIVELMRTPGMSIQEANRMAGEIFDPEWNQLERQCEFNRMPGNRRGSR